MSPKANVKVKFWEAFDFTQIVDLLLSAGWVFPDETVVYESYQLGSYDHESLSVPVEQWPQIRSYLADRFAAGFTVTIDLVWPESNIYGDLTFTPDYSFDFTFMGREPALEGCPNMVDYSWFLQRIACPVLAANLNVEEFVCTHSFD